MIRKLPIAISVLSLLTGTLVYLLFRSGNLTVFSWLRIFHLQNTMAFMRQLVPPNKQLPDWFLYAMPDGLWLFSYVTFLLCMWNKEINISNIYWIAAIPSVAIGSELGQLFKLVPGTFDIQDLFMYAAGAVLPFILLRNDLTFKLRRI